MAVFHVNLISWFSLHNDVKEKLYTGVTGTGKQQLETHWLNQHRLISQRTRSGSVTQEVFTYHAQLAG